MKLSINLASRRHYNKQALKLTLSGIFIFLLCLLVLQGNSYLKNWQLAKAYRFHLDELQEQLRGKLPERLSPEQLEEQRSDYDQAEALLKRDSFRWTELFDQMENLLPDGVSLHSFNPDYNKNSLEINGVAKDLKSLQALLDNLQTGHFTKIYLQNQGEVKVNDGRGDKRTGLSFSVSLAGGF